MSSYQKLKEKYSSLSNPIKASFWFTISKFLQKGIALITTPIFTRLLSTEQYGIVNVFYSWHDIILIIVTLNLAAGIYNNGLLKFKENVHQYTSSLLGLTSTLNIVFLLIYLIGMNYWNQLLGLPTVLILALFVQLFFSSAMELWSAQQRFEYKYKLLIAVSVGVAVVAPLLAVISIQYFEDGAMARILSYIFIQIIAYQAFYFIIMKRGKMFYNLKYWKFAFFVSLPLIPHYLSQVVLNNSDRILINSIQGAKAAGIYSVAYSSAMLLNILNQSLNASFLPWIYKKLESHKEKQITSVFNSLCLFVGVMNSLLILFAPELVAILAPASYHEAIWVIPPVSLSVYMLFLSNTFINIEMYYEKSKLIMTASVLSACFSIGMNIIFINIFGYIAAAYVSLSSYILLAIFHYYFVVKYLKVKIFNRNFLIMLSLALIVFSFIIMSLYNHFLIRMAIIFIIAATLFFNRNKLLGFMKSIRKGE